MDGAKIEKLVAAGGEVTLERRPYALGRTLVIERRDTRIQGSWDGVEGSADGALDRDAVDGIASDLQDDEGRAASA